MSKFCYNCINSRVCYLPDENEEIGWRNECNICINRDKKIKFRVYWDVGCLDSPFRLRRDVCEDYLEILEDCSCSKTQRNRDQKEYIYE